MYVKLGVLTLSSSNTNTWPVGLGVSAEASFSICIRSIVLLVIIPLSSCVEQERGVVDESFTQDMAIFVHVKQKVNVKLFYLCNKVCYVMYIIREIQQFPVVS